MATVPPELIIDVLSKVSVKSLYRFKCVSKSWRTLIIHPRFAKLHLHQTQRQKLLLIGEVLSSVDLQTAFDGEVVVEKFDYPLKEKPDSNWISVYNSFNGLFCISPESGVSIVYNPSTRESKKIPKPVYFQRKIPDSEMLSGFGYVESIDDYKFVVVDWHNRVHVFSLKNNYWKIVRVDFPFDLISTTTIIGIPLNGAIHWVLNDYRYDSGVIVAFDLVEEKFRLLSLPDSIMRHLSWIRLRVIGECLCIFYKENEIEIAFWIMKEYGVKESWTRIPISDISPYKVYAPLCLWKNQGMLTVASDNRNLKWAICYQQDGDSCKNFDIQGIRPNGVHAYMESLVSLNYNSNFTINEEMDNYLLNFLPRLV